MPSPTVWFAVVFSGRTSVESWTILAAHVVAARGNPVATEGPAGPFALPEALVPKYDPADGGGVGERRTEKLAVARPALPQETRAVQTPIGPCTGIFDAQLTDPPTASLLRSLSATEPRLSKPSHCAPAGDTAAVTTSRSPCPREVGATRIRTLAVVASASAAIIARPTATQAVANIRSTA